MMKMITGKCRRAQQGRSSGSSPEKSRWFLEEVRQWQEGFAQPRGLCPLQASKIHHLTSDILAI